MPSTIVEALRDIERALSGLDLRWYPFGAQAAIIHGSDDQGIWITPATITRIGDCFDVATPLSSPTGR